MAKKTSHLVHFLDSVFLPVVSLISSLEQKLGIRFRNENLLKEALTHRSYVNENPSWPVPHNERLEYLGDAVLELATTEFLFRTYPTYQEGQLTNLRAALVNYQMLSKIARELSLEQYLFLSKGEAKDGGKAREVILANAMEALIGAAYLDQGYDVAQRFIAGTVFRKLKEVIERGLYRDPKSVLQETVQETMKITPTYRVLREEGPDHQKNFLVGVFFAGKKVAEAWGFSKQEAELKAAETALAMLRHKERHE